LKVKAFKLNLLAAGFLLAAGAVSAQQANVTEDKNIEWFGVLGSGFVSGTGFGTDTVGRSSTWTGISDQPHSSNRLGVRGQRQMDQGTYVKYTLESNFSLRTGTIGKDSGGTGTGSVSCSALDTSGASATPSCTSGAFFDREANFSIGQNDLGQIQFGRGKNFLYNVLDDFDSRGNWNLGGLKPIARYAGFYSGSGVSRFDNMLRISTASFYNFRFDVAKSFGNQIPTATTTDGKSNSVNYGIRYTDGPLDVAYTTSSLKLSSETVNQKINLLAAKYQLTPELTVNVGTASTKNPTAPTTFIASAKKVDGKTTAGTMFYGAKYRLTERLTLNGGLYSVSDKATAGAQDVSMSAFGAQYAIGKNAEIFVDYVKGDRKGSANTALFTIYDRWYPDSSSVSESTVSQRALSVGAQIRF
jgi:predicted porin